MSQSNNKDTSTVVVIGRNYGNILTMTRSLGQAGYRVRVVRVYKKKLNQANLLNHMKPDALSKYVDSFTECITNGNLSKLVQVILNQAGNQGKRLIVPVDDYTAWAVDVSMDQLRQFFVLPNLDDKQGEITRFMDKNMQKDYPERFGIPVLKSTLLTCKKNEIAIPDGITYPCFMKPNVSNNGKKTLMQRCDSKEALQKVLECAATDEPLEILVEPYVEIKAEYSLLGVAANHQVVAPALFRALEGGHRERKGIALRGETVVEDRFVILLEKCKAMIADMNYTGMFDLDFIESTKGEFYFLEMNYRAGASMQLFTEIGVNLPGMYADYMLKELPFPATTNAEGLKSGIVFANEKVMLEEFAKNDLGYGLMQELIKTSDIHFIRDDADPKPYRNFKLYVAGAFFMKLPYFLRQLRNYNLKQEW